MLTKFENVAFLANAAWEKTFQFKPVQLKTQDATHVFSTFGTIAYYLFIALYTYLSYMAIKDLISSKGDKERAVMRGMGIVVMAIGINYLKSMS
ncbi:hypothetical protein [Halobacteriovorax sp. CON-3]|uniref:hypothetical protein n=1 Tax=Halobacteriovorax sp. CON-3 TaxID=3157710 RepID=UPI00371012A2